MACGLDGWEYVAQSVHQDLIQHLLGIQGLGRRAQQAVDDVVARLRRDDVAATFTKDVRLLIILQFYDKEGVGPIDKQFVEDLTAATADIEQRFRSEPDRTLLQVYYQLRRTASVELVVDALDRLGRPAAGRAAGGGAVSR